MKKATVLIILCLILLPQIIFAQQVVISGYVINTEKAPIFAASIKIGDSRFGSATDAEGYFSFSIDSKLANDTIVISCIGYETASFPIKYLMSSDKPNHITLNESVFIIDDVVVVESRSVTKEFAIEKLEAIDIYMTPSASADPLKAISRKVFSSNMETAEPELRGSQGDYTRVYLNNVPIYKPIRNQQFNGLGNFSVLNGEVISSEDVYPSNPPLKNGGSIAGLVDAKTINSIDENSKFIVNASLANLGLFYSQRINNKQFFQLFGNYQFSPLYKWVNPYLDYISSFQTLDIGLNYRFNISKNSYINLYSYYIDEKFNSEYNLYNYSGPSDSDKKRNFNILNYAYTKDEFSICLNIGTDWSESKYLFGNIDQMHTILQTYSSLDFQYLFKKPKISVQAGLSNDFWKHDFTGQRPKYHFLIKPSDPKVELDNKVLNSNLEAYIYGKWNWNNILIIGGGFRKNIPLKEQNNFLSYQGSIKYNFLKRNSLLFSIGNYNAYSIPENSIRNIFHIQSQQYAIDYIYNILSWKITAAAYIKLEQTPMLYDNTGNILNTKQNIKGAELSVDYFYKNILEVGVSYTFIDAHFKSPEKQIEYEGYNDMDYMIRSYMSYYNPKLFNISLNYTLRPGYLYTPVLGVTNINDNLSIPLFDKYNSERYNTYSSLDFTINRYFKIKGAELVVYLSVNNILNNKNQRHIYYNDDYSESLYRYYQERTLYFGFRFSL